MGISFAHLKKKIEAEDPVFASLANSAGKKLETIKYVINHAK